MASTDQLPNIILFGDSLTEWGFYEDNRGFGWAMEQHFAGKANVLNKGLAGYNSTWIKSYFGQIIQQANEPYAPPTLLFTIFLGANDACLPPAGAHVPLNQYEENIREFVEIILTNEAMADTKIVLITPPPINIQEPLEDTLNIGPAGKVEVDLEADKNTRGYRTYMSKKRYADKVMEIAKSYEDVTDQVIGLNFWKALIDTALEQDERLADDDAYDENRLPGCGLAGAKGFKQGYFTDGLHLDRLGYEVLFKELMASVLKKWPEMDKNWN
ncbi:SGNH hydrolase [Lepidopterella palustris CBS 459.81]|uniref:SGNH hydrolase n=1 Tax=Lepidopterella palustris CBS 459.81 TaxID=1314670 RepID=A0A8E2J9H4_9PEZI|nr:SGNH hydrolase [Lepidopterella palustris CBS 459.81]